MTPKRIVLSIMTLLVVLVMGQSLIDSLGRPQVGNQLQLYQTDLLVQASEWDGSGLPEAEVQQFRNAVFGEDALASASEQYLEVRKDSATGLARLQQQLEAIAPNDDQARPLATTAKTQQTLVNQLDLRLGMVQAKQGDVPKALDTWQRLAERSGEHVAIAQTLSELWQTPPVLRPETATVIDSQLKGWFRYSALERLYTVQNKTDELTALQAAKRSVAESTLIQLSVVGLLPSFGALLGTAGVIALVGQRLLRGKDSLLAIPAGQWTVPWDWEVIWQVVVGGFLFVGQFVVPLLLAEIIAVTRVTATAPVDLGDGLAAAGLASTGLVMGLSSRGRAVYSLAQYLLMSVGTLGVLYWSVKAFLPLSKEWFRVKLWSKWPLWGFGSYLVALPLMLGVSLLNQQIWQGQGGNNPILQLVLEEQDSLALGLFFFTAAIAAPVFEEILFRGFLLPSLTRYMPVWGAIGLSSLIFAAAHLSFSEVLPLTVLGAILGFAYVRSRNLLSSILLHSTWNSVTMIGLLLLGSSGR